MAEPVEECVHESGFLPRNEGMGDIDIGRDDGRERHVSARDKLVGASAKELEQQRIKARKCPAWGKVARQEQVQFVLSRRDSAHEIIEKGHFRRGDRASVNLLFEVVRFEAMGVKLGHKPINGCAGHGTLVESLDRAQPRCRPALAMVRAVTGAGCRLICHAKRP